jgi:hypothetical protein
LIAPDTPALGTNMETIELETHFLGATALIEVEIETRDEDWTVSRALLVQVRDEGSRDGWDKVEVLLPPAELDTSEVENLFYQQIGEKLGAILAERLTERHERLLDDIRDVLA